MTYSNLFTGRPEPAIAGNIPFDPWERLHRYLFFGSETGVYSVPERPVHNEDLESLRACLREDGVRVVRTIVDTAATGCELRTAPALHSLALASSPSFASAETNAAALTALAAVVRTGGDLCRYIGYVDQVRGWGRGLRSAIANWYLSKSASELAALILREPGAGDWTHSDLVRLSHPKASNPALNALFQWAVEGALGHLATADIRHGELRQVFAFEHVKGAVSEGEVVRWIEEDRLTHEMIPSQWKRSPRVWEALLEHMPYASMLAQLGTMAAVGLFGSQSPATALVVARLMDRRRVLSAKVQPFSLLCAMIELAQLNSLANVLTALEDAFYMALDNVEPIGGRIYVVIDSSAPPQLAAGLALTLARKEAGAIFWRLKIGRRDQLHQVCEVIGRVPPLGNLAISVIDARIRRIPVDAFLILTGEPPFGASDELNHELHEYRRALCLPAKLVLVGMTAGNAASAIPLSSSQLNIGGFDPTVPVAIARFLRS